MLQGEKLEGKMFVVLKGEVNIFVTEKIHSEKNLGHKVGSKKPGQQFGLSHFNDKNAKK